MRSGFGRFSQEMRARLSLTQVEFSKRAGWSASFTSNLEFGRAPINDDVVSQYFSILALNGKDRHQMRQLALASEKIRMNRQRDVNNPEVLAFLDVVGERLPNDVVEKIKKLAEDASGESFSYLTLASNQMADRKQPKKAVRYELRLSRFVEIALLAQRVRQDLIGDLSKIDVCLALEKLSAEQSHFDYQIVQSLPKEAMGAFAMIIGSAGGHTILLEEERAISAENGVVFYRHAIAHELGHHFLHPHLLVSDKPLILTPTALSQIQTSDLGAAGQINQVIDSIEELEAELFALFFLIPWFSFFKGTAHHHLASDFGEQKSVVDLYGKYFHNPSIADEFRMQLWKSGDRSHPMFHQK